MKRVKMIVVVEVMMVCIFSKSRSRFFNKGDMMLGVMKMKMMTRRTGEFEIKIHLSPSLANSHGSAQICPV